MHRSILGVIPMFVLWSCGGGRGDSSTTSAATGTETGEVSTTDDESSGGASETTGATDCPVDPLSIRLLEEAIVDNLLDALTVAGGTSGSMRTYASSLLGTDRGTVGFFDRLDPCGGVEVGEPFCLYSGQPEGEVQDEFEMTRDACFAISCESETRERLDVFYTMRPHTSVHVRHPFSYAGETVDGVFDVDPNPLVSWILDFVDGEAVTVFAELDHAARLVRDDTIDFSYTGSVTVVEMGTGSDRLDLDLTFASLSDAVVTVELGLDITEGGALLGSVRHGDAELGSVTGVFGAGPPEFSWPNCGE
jgi:hypothetical protein